MPLLRRTRLITRIPRALANCATSRPTAPVAAFCTSTSPRWRPRCSSRETALKGMATSWAAASSGSCSGSGISEAAGAVNSSAQAPETALAATRSPTARCSTPSPSASTTATASLPAPEGSSGRTP